MHMFLAQSRPWIHLASRVLLALYFLWAGLDRLTHMTGYVAEAKAKHAPLPQVGVPAVGVLLFLGGLTVLLGWHRYIGGGLLVIGMMGSAFVRNAFWRESDPAARANALTHFLKDLALAGAALFVAMYSGPSWPFSLGG
jgi:putative oxidoreductase